MSLLSALSEGGFLCCPVSRRITNSTASTCTHKQIDTWHSTEPLKLVHDVPSSVLQLLLCGSDVRHFAGDCFKGSSHTELVVAGTTSLSVPINAQRLGQTHLSCKPIVVQHQTLSQLNITAGILQCTFWDCKVHGVGLFSRLNIGQLGTCLLACTWATDASAVTQTTQPLQMPLSVPCNCM